MSKITFIAVSLFLLMIGVAIYWKGNVNSPYGDKKNSEMLAVTGSYEILTADINYFEDVRGFFVDPQGARNHAGVVMIHEWWGLNENIKDMARSLGREGYMVLAVDLFGKVASTPEEARGLTSTLDKKKAIKNLQAAATYLRNRGVEKIASLGWCFGGGQSLQLALSGENLDATVVYYGQLVSSEEELSAIKWPVLGIFGDKDQSIPVDSVKKFDKALDRLGVNNEVYIYPGVGHAFANPSGVNYAPDATKDAWEKTISFLAKHLQ